MTKRDQLSLLSSSVNSFAYLISFSFLKTPPACCSTTAINNQSATVSTMSNNQSTPGIKVSGNVKKSLVSECPYTFIIPPSLAFSSLVPTPGLINKKAKSRLMDKDHNRNRLSHTSAPIYFAKSKRPSPEETDGVGAINRLPGGQHPLPRRQRSLHTKGKNHSPARALSSHA